MHCSHSTDEKNGNIWSTSAGRRYAFVKVQGVISKLQIGGRQRNRNGIIHRTPVVDIFIGVVESWSDFLEIISEKSNEQYAQENTEKYAIL